MNIFNRKIKKKHIEQFEQKIADLLYAKMPELRSSLAIGQIAYLSIPKNHDEIVVLRSYESEEFQEIKKSHRTRFNLDGISVRNRKKSEYTPFD